jgi:hypothetical protein
VSAENERQALLSQTADQIIHEVAEMLGNRPEIDLDKQTCRKFVNDASDLGMRMRESHIKYDFDFNYRTSPENASRVMYAAEIGDVEVFDVATGQQIPKKHKVTVGEGGRVGDKLAMVFPGLTRQSRSDEVPLVLQKPAIIVQFDKPIERVAKPRDKESTSSV